MLRLKKVRIYADVSQKDVAKMLGVAYVSYNTWEREYDIIPLRQLDKFCNIFHVDFFGNNNLIDLVKIINKVYNNSKIINKKFKFDLNSYNSKNMEKFYNLLQ